MTAVGMSSGYFADNPSKAVSRKVSVPTEPRARRIWFVFNIEGLTMRKGRGDLRVFEVALTNFGDDFFYAGR
jgi:hypothetical protein